MGREARCQDGSHRAETETPSQSQGGHTCRRLRDSWLSTQTCPSYTEHPCPAGLDGSAARATLTVSFCPPLPSSLPGHGDVGQARGMATVTHTLVPPLCFPLACAGRS